jgi:hypothetical protein
MKVKKRILMKKNNNKRIKMENKRKKLKELVIQMIWKIQVKMNYLFLFYLWKVLIINLFILIILILNLK